MEEGWDVGSAFKDIKGRLAKLEALEHAQERLASESDPDAILDVLAGSAADIIGAETLAVTILSDDKKGVRYEHVFGKHAGALRVLELPIENAGLCGWVLANRKPILSVNLLEDPRIARETAIALGIHTAVLTPLIAKGKIIGGLSAFNKSDGSKFDADDLAVLSQLSGYAALAVVNARLVSDAEREKVKAEVVLNSIADGLVFVTCDGLITEANRAVLTMGLTSKKGIVGMNVRDVGPGEPLHRLIGWDVGAAPGEHCWELLPCEDEECPVYGSDALRCWAVSDGHCRIAGDRTDEREKIWTLCADCEVMKTASKRLSEPREVDVGGRTLSVTSAIVLESVRDRIAGELLVFHDITAEKELERHRGEFISMLSHDLKVPISSLIGYSEMIGQEDDPDTVRELNAVVKKNAARLLGMINNILDYSRAESGRLDMDRVAVGLRPFLGVAMEPFGPAAGEKGVTLTWEVEDGTADAYADIDMLTRVLGNLVQNSLEHLKRGGSIVVEAKDGPEGFVEIAVKDDGPGIKPEHLPRLFDKYYSPGKNSIGGRGLGLYIVKVLTGMLGGRVGVESEEGRGAVFRVLVPAATQGPKGA